ncbi:hypothetical protein ACWIGW_23110 [Nocardia brasiliensis]
MITETRLADGNSGQIVQARDVIPEPADSVLELGNSHGAQR